MLSTQDLRISSIEMLKTPSEMEKELPIPDDILFRISEYRKTVADIIHGKDSRLLAIIGPCSIHDPKAALEYAAKLKKLADEVSDVFFIVMRTYFEKPRTALGWKGLIADPDMDESCKIEKGLMIARRLLLDMVISLLLSMPQRARPAPHRLLVCSVMESWGFSDPWAT